MALVRIVLPNPARNDGGVVDIDSVVLKFAGNQFLMEAKLVKNFAEVRTLSGGSDWSLVKEDGESTFDVYATPLLGSDGVSGDQVINKRGGSPTAPASGSGPLPQAALYNLVRVMREGRTVWEHEVDQKFPA